MEYYLHIKPTFDCLIKYNNQEQLLNNQKIYSFLISSQDKINLLVYPLEEQTNSLPFAFLVTNKNNTISTNCNNAEVIAFPDNNYLINLQPFYFAYPKSTLIKTKKINLNNLEHTISWIKNNKFDFAIENNKNSNCLELTHQAKVIEINTKTSNNSLLCYFKTTSNTYLIVLLKYNNNNYDLINFEEVDILEEENNVISTYKKLNDFADHGVICEYNFNDEFSFKTHLAYNNDLPFISRHKEIIPFAFFEAIKIENYNLARIYLTEELSNKLSDKHLKSFFGDFIQTHQSLSKEYNHEDIALIYEGNPKYAKIFHIKLNENNKIANIYD